MALPSQQLGKRLRSLRRSRNWTLRDVENESGGTLRASTIGAYERGTRVPPVDRLGSLADFYGVSLGSLLGVDESELTRDHGPDATTVLTHLRQVLSAPRTVLVVLPSDPMDRAGEPPPP